MKHWFWYVVVTVAIVGEAVAIFTGTETLSSTYKHVRDSLPLPFSVLLSAVLAGLLMWLLSVHWIFSSIDKEGFDFREQAFVIIGVLLGVIGGISARRKLEDDDDEA